MSNATTGQPSRDSTTNSMEPQDMAAAQEVMGRVMSDLGGAMASLMCALGDRLGLFRTLAATGSATSDELAARAGLDERCVREWLRCLGSAGYLDVDRTNGRFSLPTGLALTLAAEGSPFAMAAGYQLLPALTSALGAVEGAFRHGGGVAQDSYGDELYEAMQRMSASWLETMLLSQWIPAVEGLTERLKEGARVADVGCGGGKTLILLAQAFPNSRFIGFDSYAPNVERATAAARAAGVSDLVRFEHADAQAALSGKLSKDLAGRYELVTAFDILHDAKDPAGMLHAIGNAIGPDGVLLLLESQCSDNPLDNTGPAATILYATSVLYCLPTSLAEDGAGLGTLGLPGAAIRDLCSGAGLRSVHALPNMNPFNVLYEIRP